MGLNDPQWGKNKGDSGPPDLDDVLKNVNKKISDIFGKKGGNGGGNKKGPEGGGPAHMGGKGITLILLMLDFAGFIRSVPLYFLMLKPRKLKPSSMCVMSVFSSDRVSPRVFRNSSIRGLTSF